MLKPCWPSRCPGRGCGRVYALLGLVTRYGAARVEEMCELALAAELFDVTRLKRMLALAAPPPAAAPAPPTLATARYLRPRDRLRLGAPDPGRAR